jgi:predicted ATPase/DNA-binding CsgD family transcriptional regulator
VLDNCEHVIDAAASLCAALLVGADDVRILATSREPLHIAGESRYRLGPLTLPDPDDPDDPDGAGRGEAVALFADRARRADASFTLDAETAPAVARLVARLDGMPLAIELAAAQVEALGVAQLLEHIDDRFGLLAGADRLAADRQRSLAATVQWSYQLLTPGEQQVFRAISVFPGPFTLAAAEAVSGEEAGSAVLRLVDCSLLTPPRAGGDGRSRYLMLETLRAYGARLLSDGGEAEAAMAALAGYAVALAAEAGDMFVSGADFSGVARRLDAEDATLRHVLAWALEHDAALALRLAVNLAGWWLLRGRLASQAAALRSAADRAAPGSGGWIAAQIYLAQACLQVSDPNGAVQHYTVAIESLPVDAPPGLVANCFLDRAFALAELGEVDAADRDARRASALAAEAADTPFLLAAARASLSLSTLLRGDNDEALRLARLAGQGSPALPAWLARVCDLVLTIVLIEVGDLAEAERTCVAGLARARAAGDVWSMANLLPHMVFISLSSGRLADAAAQAREHVEIAIAIGVRRHLLSGLRSCGYLCAATGRAADAVTIWAAADALRPGHEGPSGAADSPWTAHLARRHRQQQEIIRAARAELGPAGTVAAVDRGSAMSLAAAAEYARLLATADPCTQATSVPTAAERSSARLSPRERELVTLVARGRTDAQIAAELTISVRTVTSHLDRIRDKTGCRRRADLTRLAVSDGLV